MQWVLETNNNIIKKKVQEYNEKKFEEKHNSVLSNSKHKKANSNLLKQTKLLKIKNVMNRLN